METPWLSPRDAPNIITSLTGSSSPTASLTVNLVCRVTLALLANVACLVPLRLLYKNGEFAAVVFIANVEVKNSMTILYSLLWRNDDMDSWWPGYGLCDIHPYLYNLTLPLFTTCLLAVMRNLAQQVSMMRVNPLTVREKRRRNLVQALIMFPLPLIQLAFTWPLTFQRYVVGTLVGCTWLTYPAWPYLVFFIIAPALVALATAAYAVLVYFRFRQVAKNTRTALSSNRTAIMRARRTRRRLYLMVISILTPFLPVVCTLAVLNIVRMQTILPFDYKFIHNHTKPYPWNTIVYYSSKDMDFSFLSNAYISILAGIPIFLFFGMTKDAVNDYRRVLLALGFGRFFPRLHREYDPDKQSHVDSSARSSSGGIWSSNGTSTSKSKPASRLAPLVAINFSTSHGVAAAAASAGPRSQSLDDLISINLEPGPPLGPAAQPARHTTTHWQASPREGPTHLPTAYHPPNPFMFRTRFDLPTPFRFPYFKIKPRNEPEAPTSVPLRHLSRPDPHKWYPHPVVADDPSPRVHTRVWSDEQFVSRDEPLRSQSSSLSLSGRPEEFFRGGVIVERAFTRETHHARQP